MKRVLVVLLAAIVMLSVLPQIALADGGSGTSGDVVTASPSPNPTPTIDPDTTVNPDDTDDTDDSVDDDVNFIEPDATFDSAPQLGTFWLDDATTPTPSLTTGLLTTTGYHPVNIQIENSPDARPQSGLSQADIVYECLMEHRSVTRFQAVFNDNLPTLAGPVRSCRIYFVDIAAEYKGILAFYGGPTSTVANIKPKIADAISNGNLLVAANGLGGYNKYYWRVKTRSAPHNVYTNVTKLAGLYANTAQPVSVSHFLFDAGADYSAYEDMTTVEVKYTNVSTYDDVYKYDPVAQNYKRYVAGKPFTDANTKKQITVKNIIVQRAVTTDFGTKKGHLNINLIGAGTADVFVEGKHIAATWSRPTQADITKYYDSDGHEIPLQPGNTWVQVIPSNWAPHYFSATSISFSPISSALNVKVGTPTSVTATSTSYNSIKLSWGAAASATRYEIYRSTTSGGPYKLIATTTAKSYINKSVTTGTPYYYKVVGYRVVYGYTITGDYSDEASATTSLSAPQNPKAVAISYNSIKLTWKAVAGATKYDIYRSLTTNDSDFTLLATTSATSYTDKNVDTGTPYYYKVCACRSGKEYGPSEVKTATASLGTPGHARAVAAPPTSIRLTWGAVPGAGAYEIYKEASDGTFALLATVTSPSCTDSGLTTGTTYYYKVLAYRLVGVNKVTSAYSAVVHAKP